MDAELCFVDKAKKELQTLISTMKKENEAKTEIILITNEKKVKLEFEMLYTGGKSVSVMIEDEQICKLYWEMVYFKEGQKYYLDLLSNYTHQPIPHGVYELAYLLQGELNKSKESTNENITKWDVITE